MAMPAAHPSANAVLAKDTASRRTQEPSAAHAREAASAQEIVAADICVIGAGGAGLAVATGAAAVGQRVVLIEKSRLGGSSLNTGCVPSKALLAAARRAHAMRTAQPFGISPVHPAIDFSGVRDHVSGVIEAITPTVTPERYAAMGIMLVPAAARFIDKATVEAGDLRIRARRFVIATGASPDLPDIPGLDGVAFFTNETIFDNARKLDRLIVIGGNAAALELAQAYQRLGTAVVVLEAGRALADEDPELATVALRALRGEGLDIREGASVDRVEAMRAGVRATVTHNGSSASLEGSHLLIAAGRRANISDLNLGAAGIKAGPRGITVNAALRTSNRRVYAIGDVTGAAGQAHHGLYHAGIFLKRALFRLRAGTDARAATRVTFTDPEIAWVGLDEEAARAKHGRLRVLRWPYTENDRAQAERTTEGHVKIVASHKGTVLGAGIVGAQASELVHVWALAISQGLSLNAVAECAAAHPTLSEVNRSAAALTQAATAGRPLVRWLVRFLGRFG